MQVLRKQVELPHAPRLWLAECSSSSADPAAPDSQAAARQGLGDLTWTPKTSSEGWRLRRAHSGWCPCSRLVASAISPQVMSAPSALHTRLQRRGSSCAGPMQSLPCTDCSTKRCAAARCFGVLARELSHSGTTQPAAARAACMQTKAI